MNRTINEDIVNMILEQTIQKKVLKFTIGFLLDILPYSKNEILSTINYLDSIGIFNKEDEKIEIDTQLTQVQKIKLMIINVDFKYIECFELI
jgi:hypothetical protein